jgi:hypothetical protein
LWSYKFSKFRALFLNWADHIHSTTSFQIGVYFQHVEELFPEAFFRPVIEDFVDRILFTEMLWQISPGHTGSHFEQNAFDGSTQTCLVIQTELKQYFS